MDLLGPTWGLRGRLRIFAVEVCKGRRAKIGLRSASAKSPSGAKPGMSHSKTHSKCFHVISYVSFLRHAETYLKPLKVLQRMLCFLAFSDLSMCCKGVWQFCKGEAKPSPPVQKTHATSALRVATQIPFKLSSTMQHCSIFSPTMRFK